MKSIKTRGLNLIFTLMMVLSIFVPSVVKAYTVNGDNQEPKLTIHKYQQESATEWGDEEPPEDEDGADADAYSRALPNNGNPGNGMADQFVPSDAKAVEGVTYEIKQTHAYDLDTDTWSEVKDGVSFTKKTNKDGEIVLTKADGLKLGRYTVQEIAGPSHIIINNTKFSVDIPMTSKDGKQLNYDVHIYPKNEILRGDVTLKKEDSDGNPLSGIQFGIFTAEGKPALDVEGNEINTLTTNQEGEVSVSGLLGGKYYFQEIKTIEGYALNTSKLEFEVKLDSEGNSDVVWTPQNKYLTEDGTFTNYKTPTIEKDVEGENKLSVDRNKEYKYNLSINTPMDIENYAELEVTDTLDDRLEYAGSWSVTGTEKENISFKKEGQTLVWSVKDLSLLESGKQVKITFTAKIKPDAVLEADETGIPNTAKIDFDNNKGSHTKPKDPNTPPTTPPTETPPVTVDPTEGGFKVIKVDKKDHNLKLEGAEFKLTTDKEGKEVVDASGTVIEVNGERVEGTLQGLLTGKNGEIAITGLTPGTYYLHETKAPTYQENGESKPYRLLTKPVEVVIEDKIMEKEAVVENSKSGWDLPTTGGMGTILFTVAGLGFMLLALVLYNRREEDPAV